MATDINPGSLVYRISPLWLHPYLKIARLDRPVGIWLVLLPGWWSLSLASASFTIPFREYILFAAGAVLMRSAGCVCNDLVDQDLDAQVQRTRSRPLVDTSLTRLQAYLFLMLLLVLSCVILFQFNSLTIAIGCISVCMVAVYPWMKRITFWPQAFLGLTFNTGILMGWVAIRNQIDAPVITLYLAAFFWTLHYDTIYAHQDKEDDLRIGVRSTALKFKEKTMQFLVACNVCFGALLIVTGFLCHMNSRYYVGVIVAVAFNLFQSFKVDLSNPAACLNAFKQARLTGWIVLASILVAIQ